MNRQFSQVYIVRYDECDCHGCLTPAAFLRYMQDVAARDAEDAQLSGNGYWVVRRTVISFTAPVQTHTALTIRTYGIGFTRITAQRGYDAYLPGREAGEPVISARTLWVYVDARGRPARLPERTAEIWLPDGPHPQLPEVPLPAAPESQPATTAGVVCFSDIDPMRHLNNAAAVEMFDDAAWEVCSKHGITPDTNRLSLLDYEIDYLDSPRFGEQLEIQSWHDPFPSPGQQYTRFQQILHEGSVMVRARSRWQCG